MSCLVVDAVTWGQFTRLCRGEGDAVVCRQVALRERGFAARRQGHGQRTDALSRREAARDDGEARSFVLPEQIRRRVPGQLGTIGETFDRAGGKKDDALAIHLAKKIRTRKRKSQ